MSLLDVKSRSKTYGTVLLDLQKPDNKYLIMITHRQSMAQTAGRVLQVSDGELTDLGRCWK